jgi:putative peptidoglycan lipid II flippase
LFVATGIFLSRLLGLVRQRVIAHYFGLGDVADAWASAFRIPNALQNLFGDQALSASFIPAYASLLASGDSREADRVAGAVASILSLIVSVLVLAGVLATPWLIAIIAPGFSGDKRALTMTLVRILFPGAGLLVLSAWCLGVLNSHRRFLLSYSAPIAWNVAMIATLVMFGGESDLSRLAALLAWGSVAGSFLQFAVQLPTVWRVAPALRFAIDTTSTHVRRVVRDFTPVFISRGVVQLSAYVDQLLATLLPTGAPAAILNAQTLTTLPVSLFGMAVSAAELPVMSSITGDEQERSAVLRTRLDAGLRQIAFFVVPSAVAFLALGDVVAGALFQTGRFTGADAVYVWQILAGSAVGLLASTLGRLYSSSYYALRDTRTPLNYALIRVALTTALGYVCAIPLPVWLGVNPSLGAAGLTASAGIAGWIEMLMLRRTLNARIGRTGLPASYVARLWTSAATAAGAAWAVKIALPPVHPIALAVLVVGPYGVVYFGAALLMRIPEASTIFARVLAAFK